jgi:hypothetical protein
VPARPSLRRRLLLAFVLATLAPVALLSLLHARTYVKSVEGDRVDRLGEAAYAISLQLSGTIDEHRRGLLALARAFEVQRDLSPEKLLPALRETCAIYDGFRSMALADDQGAVLYAYVIEHPEGQALKKTSVSDRSYFQAAMRGDPWFVSDAFRARGLSSAPVAGISTSLRGPDGRRVVLVGALNLDSFARFEERYALLEGLRLLLLDRQGQVVYASAAWGLEALQDLGPSPLLAAARKSGVRPFDFVDRGLDLLVGQARSTDGWTVLVAQPRQVVHQGMVRYYWFTALVTLLGLLVTIPLAIRLAARVTVPLEQLAGSLRGFIRTGRAAPVDAPRRAPLEVKTLVRDLGEMTGRLGKVLSGLLPICASCKRIRDDRGQWNQLESYVHTRTAAEFHQSTCPDCAQRGAA